MGDIAGQGITNGQVKGTRTWEKKPELLSTLADLKNELSQLRVAKVSGQGGPSKLAKIKVIKKSIARVLTVITEITRLNARKAYRNSKFKPLDLRPKKIRKIRRTFGKSPRVTIKMLKRERYFPQRTFAIKSLKPVGKRKYFKKSKALKKSVAEAKKKKAAKAKK